MSIINIGTRGSRLAVVQAQIVADAIQKKTPALETRLVTVKTTGDRLLDQPLDRIGGKGVFVKELDEALSRGEVDLCVHSFKDMPAEIDPAIPVVAVSARENPRDVLILPKGQQVLDPARPVACSSRRRQVQLAALYPGKPVAPVRGNILTRIEKLDSGEEGFSALVLAAAGIIRLGLWHRVSRVFEPEEMLPAGCQGILAVQGRAGEDHSFLEDFHDPAAFDASRAERAFVRALGCGCGAPVGVYAEVHGSELRLRAVVESGGALVRDEISGDRREAERLGEALAQSMPALPEKQGGNA